MTDKTITNGLQYFLDNENCDIAMLGKRNGNEIYPAKTYLRIFFQKKENKDNRIIYQELPSEIVVEDDLSIYENLIKEINTTDTSKKISLMGKNINILYDGMIFILCKGDKK